MEVDGGVGVGVGEGLGLDFTPGNLWCSNVPFICAVEHDVEEEDEEDVEDDQGYEGGVSR